MRILQHAVAAAARSLMGTPSFKGHMPRSAGQLVLAVAVLCTSCTTSETLAPARSPSAEPLALAQQLELPAEVTGVTGEGALYGMYVPADWNGNLVLWAHGYNPPSSPLTLNYSHFDGIRLGLLAEGYAVALSSYSENGWAVTDGATRTHQLVSLFTATFQKPTRVYLIGRSMGSLVMTKLAESHPAQYDGILAYCAFLGGAQMFADHIVNTRLLFDLYYPGVLPGEPMEPPPVDAPTMSGLAHAAMISDPAPMFQINAAMTAIGLPLPANPADLNNSLRKSIEAAIQQYTGGFGELTERGHGVPFDNWDKDYVIPAVNSGILRYRGHPDVMNYFDHAYLPSGQLKIPMVALDIQGDNVTPDFHKVAYQARVNAAGASDLLFRTTVAGWDRHCPSTAAPVLAAFQQLVTWVETGVHP